MIRVEEVKVDLGPLEPKFSSAANKAKQAAFAQRVAFDCRQHVPVDEGTWRDSEPMASDYPAGKIVWNTAYARRVYNADHVRTTKNPQAAPHWAEVTKQEKLPNWKKFAAGLLTGGGEVTIGG